MHSIRSAGNFKGDALPEVAKAIARKCRVLCLDEVTIRICWALQDICQTFGWFMSFATQKSSDGVRFIFFWDNLGSMGTVH